MEALYKRAKLTAVIAALFLLTAFGNYFYRMGECVQMTFLSCVAIGTALAAAAIEQARGRDIPHFVYLDCAVLAASVVIMCAIFAPEVCFTGMSLVPHLFMPIIMFLYYFALCNGRDCRARFVPTVVVFPTLYYIFMIAFGSISGRSVYVYFDTNAIGTGTLAVLGVAAVIMLIAVGVILLCVNKCVFEWKGNAESDGVGT